MRQVIIYPDREDGGWVAEVPSLPGCISQGRTKVEALENVRDAIETWIDGARTVGLTVATKNGRQINDWIDRYWSAPSA